MDSFGMSAGHCLRDAVIRQFQRNAQRLEYSTEERIVSAAGAAATVAATALAGTSTI